MHNGQAIEPEIQLVAKKAEPQTCSAHQWVDDEADGGCGASLNFRNCLHRLY
jgi:hypothetical protein